MVQNIYLHMTVIPSKTMCLSAVHDYLKNITGKAAETDLVFAKDALDVWLQLSPGTLIEHFNELGNPGVVTGSAGQMRQKV